MALEGKERQRPPSTEEVRRKGREKQARRRAKARAAGVVLPGDAWAAKNPERHRARVARWRNENAERARKIARESQKRRRATPWGKINNSIWPVMMSGVRRSSSVPGMYALAVGYTWATLRQHLEAQFSPEMTWENWGEVWELDHITPLANYEYESLFDPRFKEAWALSNLRPLLRFENGSKGSKVIAINPGA